MASLGWLALCLLGLMQAVSSSNLDCDFDQNWCQWVWEKEFTGSELEFRRFHQATSTPGTGPHADHTTGTGFFIYMEASSVLPGQNASIISPDFKGEGCLEFFFHMDGANVGELNIYAQTSTGEEVLIWQRIGEQGDLWTRGRVAVDSDTEFVKIRFEAVRGPGGSQGDIALDDFNFLPGVQENCPDPIRPIFPGTTTDPNAGTTIDPNAGGSTQDPNGGGSTQDPNGGGSTQDPNGGGSTQDPNGGGSTQDPNGGGSTQDPNGGGSTQDPNGGGSTQDPNGGGSTQDPNAGGSTQDPNGGGSTQDPNAGGSTQDPNGGGSTQDPNGGGSTQDPNGGGSTQDPNAGGSTQDPNGGGSTQDPNGGGSTQDPNAGGSTQDPNAGGSTTSGPGSGQYIQLECYSTFFLVRIPAFLSDGATITLTGSGDTCTYDKNSAEWTVSYFKCGTDVQYYEDHIIATNEVTIQSADGTKEAVSLECNMPTYEHINGSFEPITPAPVVVTNAPIGSLFELREYSSIDYNNEITAFPVMIELDKDIYFEIAFTDSRNSGPFEVPLCKVTQSADGHEVGETLIVNSCPYIPAVTLHGTSFDYYRFIVKPYDLVSARPGDQVYVHCDVKLCFPLCPITCPSSRKRSPLDLTMGTVHITSKPLIFTV